MPTSVGAVLGPETSYPPRAHPRSRRPRPCYLRPRYLRRSSHGAFSALRRRWGDQHGSQITDNLGLIVIGIVAIVAIGGLISGLDTTVFNWVTKQLGVG